MSPNPPPVPIWYYLDNFQFVLQWLKHRYSDLLDSQELRFLDDFAAMPQASRGLLVRMIMRKGCLFRASKLRYPEIGDAAQAAAPLIERMWISDRPAISLDELFKLFTKAELADRFGLRPQTQGQSKQELLNSLRARFPAALTLAQWQQPHPPQPLECIYKVDISAMCDRFRLMFFGNLAQDWNEFVLADLGLYRYEKVGFPESARAFHTRREVDDYLHLHECKEGLLAITDPAAARQSEEAPCAQGLTLDDILAAVPAEPYANEWLESRRGKLLLRIGLQYERRGAWERALDSYVRCAYPGVRARRIRVLERSAQFEAARMLAEQAVLDPESEEERQTLARMMPRLRRRCGLPRTPAQAAGAPQRLDLALPATPLRVEEQVRSHLCRHGAPAFYVENALVNSLFGLLCWDAVFAAVPGAFFHPFQQGPADLLQGGFHDRRRALFDACFAQLRSGRYQDTIRRNFAAKAGIQSPFVYWGALTAELLELALLCMSAEQLALLFHRLLQDVRGNRSGLPDLIQFWPADRRYRLIEVKGPGDRLQYNQLRWLDYCAGHGIPVSVCYVNRGAGS